MTRFYFVRHGKTALNVSNSFQGGEIDSPLLPESIDQAIQLGKYLADVAFDAVAVSTQKRAMDTASYLLAENTHLDKLTLRYYDDLREMRFGAREGQQIDLEDHQTQLLRNRPDLYDPSAFSGETFDELLERSLAVIHKLEQTYPNGQVLIVAHGVLLLVLINYLTGEEKRNWRKNGPLANTSVSVLQKSEASWVLERFNDTSYQPTLSQ